MTRKPVALLTVWDEDLPEESVARVPLSISVIQSAFAKDPMRDTGKIGLYLQDAKTHEDVIVQPEWVGKNLYVELAPTALDAIEPEIERVANKWNKAVA